MSAHLLPALDPATEDALRASIKRFGVLVPVLRDQHGDLVDGHHRVRLSGEEGQPCPESPVTLPDDPEARAAALASLNDDRRPRMSAEQRSEVVHALRDEGHSLRAIAGAVGVSHPTVIADLAGGKALPPDDAAAEDSAGVEEPAPVVTETGPDRITGIDGKSYPAKQNGNGKLTDEQRAQIVQRHQRGERQKDLAEEFGVSQSIVSKYVTQHTDAGDGRRRPRRGSDRRTLEGMANAANSLHAAEADLDIKRVLETQDAADIARWVNDFHESHKALARIAKGLNGGKTPK